MKKQLEVTEIYQIGNYWGVVTCNDLATNTVLFKQFDTWTEAHEWVHDVSLKQLPDWHKQYCPKCKKDGT